MTCAPVYILITSKKGRDKDSCHSVLLKIKVDLCLSKEHNVRYVT